MAISADSHWLVTGGEDTTARVWDLTAPNPARTARVLQGHEGDIIDVAISTDNHWVVTGSTDFTARIWSLRLDELVDLTCRTAGRNLSLAEWDQYFAGQPYRQMCSTFPVHPSVYQEIRRKIDVAKDLPTADRIYMDVLRLAIETNDATLNNDICWFGSIDGAAQIVVPACEHAVVLAPDEASYRDSRGLARALTGDYPGAIEDFTAFVEWSKDHDMYEQYGRTREAWIAALDAERNPFDAATLEELRDE